MVYPDEGHGWRMLETNVDFWTRVEKFLSRHIGTRSSRSSETDAVYRKPPRRHVRHSAPIAPRRGKRRMNGVISIFTPEWRSIFQARYGNPPSNVNDAFSRRSDAQHLALHAAHGPAAGARPARSRRVLGLR